MTLAPGETRTAHIELRAEDLWDYDWNLKRFFPEGTCQIRVGGSSKSLGEAVALVMVSNVDPPARRPMTGLSVTDGANAPVAGISGDITPEASKVRVILDETHLRQVVEGFGIPLMDVMGINDRQQRKVLLKGLNLRFLRARADQAMETERDRIGRMLRQIAEIDPNLEFQLSFGRPASDDEPGVDYWMDRVTGSQGDSFRLKPEREGEWADLMVSRVSHLLDSGINVTSVAIPWQEPGQTGNEPLCSWTPERLNGFITEILRPTLIGVGLDSIRIAVTGVPDFRTDSGSDASPALALQGPVSDTRFVQTGFRRVHLEGASEVRAIAFSGPDWSEIVVVVANPADRPRLVEVGLSSADYVLKGCFQTDQHRRCEAVPPEEAMPSGSVRTLIFAPGF